MKKLVITLASAALFAFASSCDENGGAAPAANSASDTLSLAVPGSLNVRYIDGDTLNAKYNLAKDYLEQAYRAYARLDETQRYKAAEILKFQNDMQQKYANNGYMSQESIDADQKKLAKMQADAETQLANMQRSVDQEIALHQLEVTDSIESFIKAYAAEKGFDMILYKGAGLYFNPALDVTNEVVEGLNARYNKVSTAK